MNRLTLMLLAALVVLPAHADAEETLRTIAVSGEGVITVVPDQARLTLTVAESNTSAERARERVEDIVGEVLEALDDQGIEKADIRSSGTALQPRYRWDNASRTQQFEGYTASRDIAVLIRNLDDLGEVLEAATTLGVSQISTPRLVSSRADSARREALTLAFDDARARAALLAKAAGLDLGEALTIDTDTLSSRPPMPMLRMAADSAEASSAPVEPGEMEIRTVIRVVFEADD